MILILVKQLDSRSNLILVFTINRDLLLCFSVIPRLISD